MADKVIVVKERRSGCGCGALVLLAVLVFAGLSLVKWAHQENAKMDAEISFARAQAKAPKDAVTHKEVSRPTAAKSAWQKQSKRDEFTDKTRTFYSLAGLPVEDGIIDYTPHLVLIVDEGRSIAAADCAIMIDPEAIQCSGTTGEVRIDRRPSETVALTPANSRSGAYFPAGFASRLDGAQTLVVRFETSLGRVRTLRFSLGGVRLADL